MIPSRCWFFPQQKQCLFNKFGDKQPSWAKVGWSAIRAQQCRHRIRRSSGCSKRDIRGGSQCPLCHQRLGSVPFHGKNDEMMAGDLELPEVWSRASRGWMVEFTWCNLRELSVNTPDKKNAFDCSDMERNWFFPSTKRPPFAQPCYFHVISKTLFCACYISRKCLFLRWVSSCTDMSHHLRSRIADTNHSIEMHCMSSYRFYKPKWHSGGCCHQVWKILRADPSSWYRVQAGPVPEKRSEKLKKIGPLTLEQHQSSRAKKKDEKPWKMVQDKMVLR